MKKTVMILAHPNMELSIANKTISENIKKLNNVQVRDVANLYPNFDIDVEAEQNELLNADRIVFQYPICWYNMPAILKHWFDRVLTYGFAHGSEFKLQGKEALVSVTTGGSEDAYAGGILESKILYPLEITFGYCKMKYASPFVLHGMMSVPGADPTPLIQKSLEHSEKIVEFLKS